MKILVRLRSKALLLLLAAKVKEKMDSLKDIVNKKKLELGKKNVTQEFQDFGLRIAERLNDTPHKSLYIKMAKEKDRKVLAQALRYCLDYPNAQKPARIFMWKVKQLEKELESLQENEKPPQQ